LTRRWTAPTTSPSENVYPEIGGTNASQIHWDIVKDLRNGGRIELDGKVVQENGRWRT
jgi:aminopeptidase